MSRMSLGQSMIKHLKSNNKVIEYLAEGFSTLNLKFIQLIKDIHQHPHIQQYPKERVSKVLEY